MIKMKPVQSSNVVKIGHDGKNSMRVEYRGDSFYDFQGVSVDDFNELEKAKSVGSHLHKMGIKGTKIKDVYCHACSVAGGADRAIHHLPPACSDGDEK